MPANFYVIVFTQTLVWLAILFLSKKPKKWLFHIVTAIWLGVVLGIFFDISLGSTGVFSYYPNGAASPPVQPKDLDPFVLLVNAIFSYGIAASTVGLLAENFILKVKGTRKTHLAFFATLTLGVIGIAYSNTGSIAMMFSWGVTIVSLGELLIIAQQKAGPLAQLLGQANPYPLLLLWAFSIGMGLLYEASNWFYSFWAWLPNSNSSRVLVEILVVSLGYFVLCHPLTVFWVSLAAKFEHLFSPQMIGNTGDSEGDRSELSSQVNASVEDLSCDEPEYLGAIREFCNFQWNALQATQNALLKGVTVYLLIFGGLTGFLFSGVANLPDHIRPKVIVAALAASLVASIAGLTLMVGYLVGLRNLRDSFQILNRRAYEDVRLASFINRGITAILMGGISAAGLVVLLSVLLWQMIGT